MKIKKLSIHGFKSFVDKVTLNFPMGTSGVIGPNGCGKSNIVDAIRWVLGEQNARHLRGKHMEDVIFNGSEARKPLGMAEVVLTFSNEEGKAPSKFASFSEIEIARRLYRSGESEYYINKVQSRLRDVVDLFTDTGIGTRAYSIIEQGQVGWLINAKPEERRMIFEEAAGINKFKHKKEAALKRLEATKENLTRVSDIISEVKRQLNSLNRQAKKAERYKALRDELKEIELVLSSAEFRNLRQSIEDITKRIEGIKDEELALTTEAVAKENLVEEVKTEYLEAEAAYKAIRERLFEIEKLIQNEERASALSKMRADELQRSEERLGAEIEELRGVKEAALKTIEGLHSSIREASGLIDSETEKLKTNSAALEEVVSELRKKEEAQRAEKAETLKLSTRLTDIRHSMQTLLRDEDFIRVREAKARSEKEQTAQTLASKEAPLNALRDEIAGFGGLKASIEAELKDIRMKLDSLESERSSKEAELKARKEEYARATARLATLEAMEKNFESLKGGPKAIMKGAASIGGGVFGLIADVIETNPGYEKAVEALLGERLQYVLVESQKEGIEAIDYLKKNGSGRASFVPVKDVRSANPVAVQAGLASAGVKELIGEVRIKEGYDAIIGYLLGEALVVEDLRKGLDLWKEEGLFRTIVTLEGEVIDPQGIITGGSSTGVESGILQRRGEIKSIKAEAQRLGEVIGRLEASISEAASSIQKTKSELESCRERLHSTEIRKVNLESDLRRQEEELARLKRAGESLEAEINDAARRMNDIASKKASLSTERDSLEEEVARRERVIAEIASVISALNEKKEGLNNIVTEIRVALARSRERLESLKKEVAEKERSIGDIDRRMEAKRQEIERGKAEAEGKLRELEASKAKIETLLGDLEKIKKEEAENASSLDAISTRIKELDAELREVKSRHSELQEIKGELTIELRETELNINNLKEKVLEKYGVEIALYNPGPEQMEMEGLEAMRDELREKITSLGEVSLSALEEYNELENRHQFLLDQQTDLTTSVEALHTAITRINRTTREKFRTTFEEINAKFQETFPRFFSGGRAELRLTEESDVLEAGVEIVAQPPGKRLQNITLLSGGEKALTATSLIFAIFLIKPSPFCLLDEVDAPLDDANIDRFNYFVKEMSKMSQFLLITHNKKTMEMADALYGITMQEPGVSKVVTMKF